MRNCSLSKVNNGFSGDMNRLAKHEYLFMLDRATAHITKPILKMLKDKQQLRLLKPHIESRFESSKFWDLGSPEFDSLKETTVEKRNKIPQEITNKCIDVFKPRLRRVIEVGDWQIG